MKLESLGPLQESQESRIFSQKKAHARTFAQIPSKPKNACNIHNSELVCMQKISLL